MRSFGRGFVIAALCVLLFSTETLADVAAPELDLAEKAALEGKTLLAPPTYAYISNGWLYWGGQAENVGVSVQFLVPEGKDAVKTGNDPVDVYKIIKNVKAPSFRIRCIPEYNQRYNFAASEWLEPEDITVDNLTGLALEGWIYVPGKWYYFVNGKQHKGWLVLGNKEYYMDPETGEMMTGWINKSEKWYYFAEENGELVKDGITSDGYEVDKAGAWTGRMTSPKKYPWQ